MDFCSSPRVPTLIPATAASGEQLQQLPRCSEPGVRAVTRTASRGGRRCRTPVHKMAPAPSCQLTHSGALAALEIRSGLDAPLPRLCLMTHPTLGNNRTEAPSVLVRIERAAASAVPHLEGRRGGRRL